MKALVLLADRTLAYTDLPDPPEPEGDWVRVKVAYAGVCGSDLPRAFGGKSYRYPLVMGHEFSAVVERPGPESRLSPGDRVAVFPLLPCRRCRPCQTGEFAQCESYDYFGSRRDGGFAEYLNVPQDNLFLVPPGVSLLEAAMTEPAAVALHGVRKLRLVPGDRAAVFGAGPIGNLAAQWLRIRGCGEVIVVDIDARKLAAAAAMGFTAVDAGREDPVEAVRRRTDGGAAAVVEAVGLPLTFRQALQAAGRFAEVLFLGNLAGELSIGDKDFSQILRRELVIYGTWNSRMVPRGRDDWSVTLAHMDGRLRIAPLIGLTPPLADGPEIFQRLAGGSLSAAGRIIFQVSPQQEGQP